MIDSSVDYDVKDWLEAVVEVLDEETLTAYGQTDENGWQGLLESPEETKLVVEWLNENARRAIEQELPAPEYVKDMRMIALISMDLLPVAPDTPEKVGHYLEQFAKIRTFAKKMLESMEAKEESLRAEEQKIKQLIEEHRVFLKKQGIDVAQSVQNNRWFCYQYNEQYKYYDFYTEFATAKELADIILDQMTFELELEEGKSVYPPELKNSNIADMVTVHYSHNYILVLEKLLQRVLNTELGKNSAFFKALDKLVTLARKEPQ